MTPQRIEAIFEDADRFAAKWQSVVVCRRRPVHPVMGKNSKMNYPNFRTITDVWPGARFSPHVSE
jgi:hypothetical protein